MTTLNESWWARVLGGQTGNLHGGAAAERYVVLPRASDPRVVVDVEDAQAMRDAVSRYVGTRTRRGVRSLSGGASALLSRRRPTWAVTSADVTLREYVSDVLGTEVRLAVAVGPDRPNLKPVARCYADSKLIAVAKLGPEPHTAEMVANEAGWLDAMAGSPIAGMTTPPLLHHGKFGDSEIIIAGSLDLESDVGLPFEEVPIEAAGELCARFEDVITLSDSPWWLELRRRLDRPDLASIAAQAAALRSHPAFDQLQVSAWHGDWSPWNMGRSRSTGKLCIWDWERAATGVPTGFDIVHLHYQYGSGIDTADSDLARIGVPAAHHDLVKRLYLMELCARHAEACALDTDRQRNVVAVLDRLRERSRA